MKLAGILGNPLSHSLSPMLHRYWLSKLEIKGLYVPIPVSSDDFSKVVEVLMHTGFSGFNVTVPYKTAALAIAHRVDTTARLAGAANLLLFSGRMIEARNTDVYGLKTSLEEDLGLHSLANQTAAVLGAGGAARAATLALDMLGAAEIRLLNRNPERCRTMAAELGAGVAARIVPLPWDRWPENADGLALLVNATSAGMVGFEPLGLSLKHLARTASVYDVVYNPTETDLLRQARSRGNRAANGLGMLIHQAAPSFEAFYGIRPPVTSELRETMQRSLAH